MAITAEPGLSIINNIGCHFLILNYFFLVCVHVYFCAWAYACRGHRSTLGVVPRELFIISFETESHFGLELIETWQLSLGMWLTFTVTLYPYIPWGEPSIPMSPYNQVIFRKASLMYFTVNLDRAKASRIESISDFPRLCDEKFIIDHLGTYVCYVKKTVCVRVCVSTCAYTGMYVLLYMHV